MKKRCHSGIYDDNKDRKLYIQNNEEISFYKEKLIKLARAHAALLSLISSEDKQSTTNKTILDAGNVPAHYDKEGDEQFLLCHSQLTCSQNSEKSNYGSFDGMLPKKNTSMSPKTNSSSETEDNETLIVDTQNYPLALPSHKSLPLPVSIQSNDGSKKPSSPDLERWNSIASQRSAFSEFIMQNMDIFVNIQELEPWIPSPSSSSPKNQLNEEKICKNFTDLPDAHEFKTIKIDHDSNTQDQSILSSTTFSQEIDNHQNKNIEHKHYSENLVSTISSNISSTEPSCKTPNICHVRVGVGVFVKDPLKPLHVFAGKRKSSHGAGTLALPGGHLEMMESWEECAKREVLEETGLQVFDLKVLHVTNDPMPNENKHYITIFMSAKCIDKNSKPSNLEPHKCEGWDSYNWDDFKSIALGEKAGYSLFSPLLHLVNESPQKVLEFFKSS